MSDRPEAQTVHTVATDSESKTEPPTEVVRVLAEETPLNDQSIKAAYRNVDGVGRDLDALADGTPVDAIDIDRLVAAIQLHAMGDDASLVYVDSPISTDGRRQLHLESDQDE